MLFDVKGKGMQQLGQGLVEYAATLILVVVVIIVILALLALAVAVVVGIVIGIVYVITHWDTIFSFIPTAKLLAAQVLMSL